jgi:hypothetical protein
LLWEKSELADVAYYSRCTHLVEEATIRFNMSHGTHPSTAIIIFPSLLSQLVFVQDLMATRAAEESALKKKTPTLQRNGTT